MQTLCCAFCALFKAYVRSTPRDASDPRHDHTLDIQYSRRLAMCGHVRWKGPVKTTCFAKGQGVSVLGLQGSTARGGWRRPIALPYPSGRFHRESWGLPCQPSSLQFLMRNVFIHSSTHAGCEGDFPVVFSEKCAFCTCRVSCIGCG